MSMACVGHEFNTPPLFSCSLVHMAGMQQGQAGRGARERLAGGGPHAGEGKLVVVRAAAEEGELGCYFSAAVVGGSVRIPAFFFVICWTGSEVSHLRFLFLFCKSSLSLYGYWMDCTA